MGQDCLECKKHWSQSGSCDCGKLNCICFEKEPKGKRIRKTWRFPLNQEAETNIVKYGQILRCEPEGKTIEVLVIRINWIDLEQMIFCADIYCYENDLPKFEKKKEFHLIEKSI